MVKFVHELLQAVPAGDRKCTDKIWEGRRVAVPNIWDSGTLSLSWRDEIRQTPIRRAVILRDLLAQEMERGQAL